MQRILAVDDEASCLEIIGFSLQSRGYEVIPVESGAQAIEFLLNEPHNIDLILLDMMMPGMTGTETLVKIREIESARLIPVVFQTGASDCESMNKNTKLESIIRKPYKRDELIEVINNALSIHEE